MVVVATMSQRQAVHAHVQADSEVLDPGPVRDELLTAAGLEPVGEAGRGTDDGDGDEERHLPGQRPPERQDEHQHGGDRRHEDEVEGADAHQERRDHEVDDQERRTGREGECVDPDEAGLEGTRPPARRPW